MAQRLNKLIIVLAVTLLASAGQAQLFEPGGPPRGGQPMGGPMRERTRERIKTVKVWKLTEELALTEAQSQRFFPIYNAFMDSREKIEEQRFGIIRKLDDLTAKENPPEAEITEQLNQLDDLDRRIGAERQKFRADLNDVLTVRQIGRLYVFEVTFMRQMQDIIRDIRKEMKDNSPGRGPRD